MPEKTLTTTERARAALRYLAEQRIAPTPDAYRHAWQQTGGESADAASPDPSAESDRGQAGPAPHDGASPNESTGCPEREYRTLKVLLAEMTRLLRTICETVPKLVEEEAWMHQQFDAIRVVLDHDGGLPDHRSFARARAMLEQTAREHQQLLQMRRDSLLMMKSMLAQCLEWLHGLVTSSDRLSGRLMHYMDGIRNSADLPTLAGVVHALIDETRTLCSELDVSKADFVAAGARARALQDEVERLAGELDSASQLVMTDHLTGLLNRRGLEKSWDELAARCRRKGEFLTLVLIDIDDFKKVNDTWGHVAGDRVLRRVAELLSAGLRHDDLIARFGGEEFVALLPGTAAETACDVVRRAQAVVIADPALHEAMVTFSAGVAAFSTEMAFSDLLACADRAMYRAKEAGKNRVFVTIGREQSLLPFDSSLFDQSVSQRV